MSTNGKKILIVEDERPLAKALELKLGKEGYETTVAVNGGDAVALLDKGGYDLIVLDLVMPQYDGFHVLEHLHEKNMKIKAIVLSNLSQHEDMQKAKDFGALEYYVKSNTPIVDLVEKVKQALL
jgi:CheY-like chemotaxis protein